METQRKQVTKSNRVTVPFYSPPTRHYGQTPSEIIREARASVMSSPVPGIKPVLTSRPFTPKERERTLFGNAKKRLSRPPSAFSLSYLQKPDALPRIKLPAIGGAAIQKKVERNLNFRSVQSLDSLVEEYESEYFEDATKSFDSRTKCLPFFRKSHSSPQERDTVRGSGSLSVVDSLSHKAPEKRSIYTISRGRMTASDVMVDSFVADEDGARSFDQLDKLKARQADKKLKECGERHSPIYPSSYDDFRDRTLEEVALQQLDRHIERREEKESEKSPRCHAVGDVPPVCEEVVDTGVNETIGITDTYKKDEEGSKGDETSHKDESAMPKEDTPSEGLRPADTTTCESSGTEKCIETDTVSNYLDLMSKRPSRLNSGEGEKKKAKEILDLYQTAEYYGVDLGLKSDVNTKKMTIEDEAFGVRETPSSADYLRAMKENIKSFDLKMKQLNSSIETFEEKLNGASRVYSSVDYNNDGTEFRMNTSRRYHITSPDNRRVSSSRRKSVESDSTAESTDKGQGVGWDGFWKNSYYRRGDEMGSPVPNEERTRQRLEECLDRLSKIKKDGGSENSEIANVTTEMYKSLKDGDRFHEKVLDNDAKIRILKSLYNFVDNEDAEILLNIARIVFSLRLESSLSDACKIVFKVARSDTNDHLFLELEDILELFLDGIGLASPLDAAECCIYGYGALKFLTMNHRVLSRLISLGVLDLLILHLKMINSAKLEGQVVNEQTQHALFQLTGALRNIAAGDGVLPLFITTNSIPLLFKIMDHFRQCEDLVTNISRTLSLLSADEDATQILMTVENVLGIIIDLVEQYRGNDKILIRLAYCLGNIVAYNDLARVQLSRSEGSIAVLLRILQLYVDKDLELSMREESKNNNSDGGDDDNNGMDIDAVDDIIVKVIRIIANMCMNPVVGSNLSPAEGKSSLLLSQLLTTLLKRKDPGITLLACLGCLNNISYYCSNHSSLIDITEGVIRVLGLHDEECQAEAARVLGNLTRHKDIRDLMSSTGGVEQLSTLLESKDKEVYRSACGALVNLMLEQEMRTNFIASHGVDKLVTGLERFSGDWSFAGLICRAIWNACADDMDSVVTHNNVDKLMTILASSLDEENWNDGDPAWEEFAFLATDLLEKINAHLEL